MNKFGQMRQEISNGIISKSSNIKNNTINKLTAADLQLLFQLYDQIFLNNWFRDNYLGKMKFSLSRRMTRSAGITLYPKNHRKLNPEALVIEIRIGVEFLFHFNSLGVNRKVCGIEARNSLEALELVFEHELCHAMELIRFKETSCRGERFKDMAYRLFGHTSSHHELPTYREMASCKLGLNIGDTVAFAFEGKLLKGLLYKINKRAVVMVKDNSGMLADKEGNRYKKYYVPVSMLQNPG